MSKVIIMFALAMGIITANAQKNVTVETTNGSEPPTLTKEVYPCLLYTSLRTDLVTGTLQRHGVERRCGGTEAYQERRDVEVCPYRGQSVGMGFVQVLVYPLAVDAVAP